MRSFRNSGAFAHFITRSKRVQDIFGYIEAVAPTSQHVLLTGETGTGKDMLARILHEISGRKGKLVCVNIACLDNQMQSDTLFGHVRGAFTGASTNREGLLAQANNGTIFLDEIGDIDSACQIKLLRLLQEGDYYPLGSDTPRKSNARIITATNRDLKNMVAEGSFRQDLYYRLNTHHVHIPPLRERKGDLQLLVEHFVMEAAASLGRPVPRICENLADLLAKYAWPGNVRELRSQIYDAS